MRHRKLVQPRLQLKIVGMFLALSIAAVVLQSLLLSRSLRAAFADDPAAMYALLRGNLLSTLAVLVPATLLVGTILTHRLAGPLFRFERFLEAVERGECPDDCRIRRRDELQGLCRLLNRVTAPLRVAHPRPGTPTGAADPEAVRGVLPERNAGAARERAVR